MNRLNEFKPTCTICGVADGDMIVRRKSNTKIWALDVDLHEEFPETWGKPRKAIIWGSGRCAVCATRDARYR